MRLSFRTAMKNNNEEQSLEVGEIPAEMNGLRMTKHRKEVYSSLLEKTDHPTATEVFDRVHQVAPTISLATVYNCLEALVSHDLVQQVNFDREPSRYCSNLKEHGHFHDKRCRHYRFRTHFKREARKLNRYFLNPFLKKQTNRRKQK